MAGIPNRKKAISLVAISTPGDLKTYPTGTYCVPPSTDGYVLKSDSTSPTGFSWTLSGQPGGIDKSIQFNSGSVFSGSPNFIYDYTTNTLSGTIAQFTTITGSTVTGSTALFTSITASSLTADLATKVSKTGDTMTGTLILATNSTTVAPAKFVSGSLLSSPVAGSVEFNGDNLYLTITSSTARKNITLNEGLTTGKVPFASTGSRLADAASLYWDSANSRLGIGASSPAATLDVGVTRRFAVYPDYAGIGDIPSNTALVGSYAANLAYFPETSAGGAGYKVIFGYYNGSTVKSAIEYANTTAGAAGQVNILKGGGSVGIGLNGGTGTAKLHITSGSATASTAPLKFTSGSLLTAPEAGAVEFSGDNLYLTITTGTSRKEIALADNGLTSGFPVYTTTNGRLTTTATGGTVVAVTSSSTPVTVPSTGGHIRVVGGAGAKLVTMPTGSGVTIGRQFIIKDAAGNASGGTITVSGSGTDTIDGASFQTITTNYGVLRIIYATTGRYELI